MKLNEIEITDFNAPELDIYARFNEAQLLHYFEPAPGVFIAESPKVIERALNAGYAPISFLAEKRLVAAVAGETRQLLDKTHRLCTDPWHALRHEAQCPSFCRRYM